jgi:hypothetical protein
LYDLCGFALRDASHILFPLVFWAMRGGGSGSWGVIIDATLPTLPIFNATLHAVNILTSTLDQTASLMTTHATHVNDWDKVWAGQYFLLAGSTSNSTLAVLTVFKDLDGDASKAQMSSFLADAAALGAVVQGELSITTYANDLEALQDDDSSGFNTVLSSRLIPGSVYSDAPESVGSAYKQLLSQGIQSVIGHLVAGGAFPSYNVVLFQVHDSRRASGCQRAYRFSSKPCMARCKDPRELFSPIVRTKFDGFGKVVASQNWDDSLSATNVQALRKRFSATARPVLAALAGGECSGSYSNEADLLEPDFRVTFFGANYPRLEKIKAAYDPNDLFIVPVGVRSEYWDSEGICTI